MPQDRQRKSCLTWVYLLSSFHISVPKPTQIELFEKTCELLIIHDNLIHRTSPAQDRSASIDIHTQDYHIS